MPTEPLVLDCRGMLCPKPVLEARRAIESLRGGSLHVLVDNLAAKENVSRAMVHDGHQVLAEETDGGWQLTVTKSAEACVVEDRAPDSVAGATVVFVTDRGLGRTDPALGGVLMGAFLSTVAGLGRPPETLALMQGGVYLACEGSPVLEPMGQLQERGVEILVCGTCLDYFGLMGKLQVGRVSNMAEITDRLIRAARVIPL